jgi:hypothetical protein
MKIEELERMKLELLQEKATRLDMQIKILDRELGTVLDSRNEHVTELNKKYNLTETQAINVQTGEVVEVERKAERK